MDGASSVNDDLKNRVRSTLFLGLYGGIQFLAGRQRLLVRGTAADGYALTFDDGPDPDITPRVADALLAAGAVGTFFMIGVHARQHPGIVRRLLRDGHQVGHHTMNHQRLSRIAPRKALEEWRTGRDVIENIAGVRCPYFRPPHGSLPPYLLPAIWKSGDSVVLWSCSTRDYTGHSFDGLNRRLAARGLRGGDILLMHDVNEVAPRLLAGIAAIGLTAGIRP